MTWNVVSVHCSNIDFDDPVVIQMTDYSDQDSEKDEKRFDKDDPVKIDTSKLINYSNWIGFHLSKTSLCRQFYTLHILEIPDPPPD